MSRYIICWRSILTGYCGEGTATFTEDMVDTIVKDQNEKWKYIIVHWKKAG